MTRRAYTVHPQWEKYPAIQALASARNPQLRDQEVSALGQAIREATLEYWQRLSKWLDQSLPSGLYEVSVSGGAAYFLEPELEDYFNAEPNLEPTKGGGISEVRSGGYHRRDAGRPFSHLRWGAGSMGEMESALGLKGKDLAYEMLRHRLVDVFGLFDCMIESESSRESKKSA